MEDLVEKLKMESILTDEEFIALLQTEDSVTRAKPCTYKQWEHA